MLKKSLSVSLLLLSLCLASCAVKPTDDPLCKELSITRGYCVNMISGKAYEVNDQNKFNGKTWWDMRPTNIQMPIDTWKNLKTFIIKVCKKYGNCDREISSWDRTLETLDKKVSGQ